MLRSILERSRLTEVDAQRLAGKVQFLCSTLFGQLGQAVLHPIYSRAHHVGCQDDGHGLNDTLKMSLQTLCRLLEEIHPRVVPVHPQGEVALLHTDAYFMLGDRVLEARAQL